jgi:hypothetical protein
LTSDVIGTYLPEKKPLTVSASILLYRLHVTTLPLKCLLSRRLGASHLYSNSNSGLANGPEHTPRPGHITYTAGSSASSALFFTGQKPTNDLYVGADIPDLHRSDV